MRRSNKPGPIPRNGPRKPLAAVPRPCGNLPPFLPWQRFPQLSDDDHLWVPPWLRAHARQAYDFSPTAVTQGVKPQAVRRAIHNRQQTPLQPFPSLRCQPHLKHRLLHPVAIVVQDRRKASAAGIIRSIIDDQPAVHGASPRPRFWSSFSMISCCPCLPTVAPGSTT